MKFIVSLILITSVSSLSATTADTPITKERSYSECFATTMWMNYGKDVNDGEIPKTVKIPEGWAPVGGGFGGGYGSGFTQTHSEAILILCKIK